MMTKRVASAHPEEDFDKRVLMKPFLAVGSDREEQEARIRELPDMAGEATVMQTTLGVAPAVEETSDPC